MASIGSSIGFGTIPLINNQGQIINPNPPGSPHSYGIQVGGSSAQPVLVGVSNPIVTNDKVIIPVTPNIPQQIFVPPQYTVSQQPVTAPYSTNSPYNYGISGSQGGGGGDSSGSSSFNLSSLILPLVILFGAVLLFRK